MGERGVPDLVVAALELPAHPVGIGGVHGAMLQCPATRMANDLTCVLVPAGQLDEARVHAIVLASGRTEAIVRVAPLPAVNLMQIEVHDARRGLPTEDPALVAAFS